MSLNPIDLKEGACIISDAHYSHLRPELIALLQDIEADKLAVTQLIFMGDIFDALFGSIEFTWKQNKQMIALIDSISKKIEVIYLEGNHDFNLQKVFLHVKVFPIQNQPVLAQYNRKKVYLAHGDFAGENLYSLYTSFIRNPIILYCLKYIDMAFNHAILKKLDAYLGKKEDCKKFENFHEFIEQRLGLKYECDYFIEGHFHQNISFDVKNFHYINLGAFACNQRYFIVKSEQKKELLEEKKFSKGM